MAIESAPYHGGFFTLQMSPHLDGLFNVETGELVVGGVAVEILRSVCGLQGNLDGMRFAMGGSLTPNPHTALGARDPASRTVIHLNLEDFKYQVERLLTQAGVRLLYHTRACDVLVESGRVTGVIVANKGGLGLIRARVVVDSTGDGDVAAWAGAGFEVAPTPQPMTTQFRVGNVRVTDQLNARCAAALEEAHRQDEIGPYGGPWITQVGPRDVVFNATRVAADRTDPFDLTRAEIEGRAQAWQMVRILVERVPEFRKAFFVSSGPEAGARETRRIIGQYTITEDDIRASRPFNDVIVRGCWYLDRHVIRQSGIHPMPVVRPYDIPFRTLVVRDLENVLVAGRCHSATHEALASTRVAITGMGMGEAAGTAAAMAAAADQLPGALDIAQLQDRLLAQGAILA